MPEYIAAEKQEETAKAFGVFVVLMANGCGDEILIVWKETKEELPAGVFKETRGHPQREDICSSVTKNL